MDVRDHNRKAWDRSASEGDQFSRAVSREVIEAAQQGSWEIRLTLNKPVPRNWLPESLVGKDVLCLAGGGGQQGPVFAAAGARVTVLDNSPGQLALDRSLALQFNLPLATLEADLADLSVLETESFDLIVHPVSNLFTPEVRPVWREAYRALRWGGSLLAGFMNPAFYIFDRRMMDGRGVLRVRHSLPYSDLANLTPEEIEWLKEQEYPLEFSHTLEDQIAGQLDAGFVLAGFYEDVDPRSALHRTMSIHLATRALKVRGGLGL